MLLDQGFPFVKYRFLVFMAIGGIPNPIDMAFQKVEGLSYERGIVRQAGMTTFEDGGDKQERELVLTRGVFGGISPLTIAQLLQLPFFHEKLLRYDVLVSLVDGDGTPKTSWVVANAYLKKWEWSDLDADANEVMTETMTFLYSTLLYIPFPMRNKL